MKHIKRVYGSRCAASNSWSIIEVSISDRYSVVRSAWQSWSWFLSCRYMYMYINRGEVISSQYSRFFYSKNRGLPTLKWNIATLIIKYGINQLMFLYTTPCAIMHPLMHEPSLYSISLLYQIWINQSRDLCSMTSKRLVGKII